VDNSFYRRSGLMGVKIGTGHLARELGIATTKVSFYTLYGLFRPASRTPTGRYLYDLDETLKRFKKIQELKEKHFRLGQIKEQLDKT